MKNTIKKHLLVLPPFSTRLLKTHPKRTLRLTSLPLLSCIVLRSRWSRRRILDCLLRNSCWGHSRVIHTGVIGCRWRPGGLSKLMVFYLVHGILGCCCLAETYTSEMISLCWKSTIGSKDDCRDTATKDTRKQEDRINVVGGNQPLFIHFLEDKMDEDICEDAWEWANCKGNNWVLGYGCTGPHNNTTCYATHDAFIDAQPQMDPQGYEECCDDTACQGQ